MRPAYSVAALMRDAWLAGTNADADLRVEINEMGNTSLAWPKRPRYSAHTVTITREWLEWCVGARLRPWKWRELSRETEADLQYPSSFLG
jgi:hypothetical protein